MPKVIAIAGKGGTGKTTVCGMLVRQLADRKTGHVLAVDADPNSNLHEVLGVKAPVTLGEIREGMIDKGEGDALPGGMTKPEYMEYMFGDALAEEDGYDLLVMGRTQGPGCYCYINGVLKTQIERYSGGYSHIIVDNEAGLEHISRGTLPQGDLLLLISDCSRRGVQAAGRAARLAEDLKLKFKSMKLIINRAPCGGLASGGELSTGGGLAPCSSLAPGILEEIDASGLDLLGVLPQDDAVYRYDSEGLPVADIPADSPVKAALREIVAKLELSTPESEL